jgi:hypothetical protein
MKIKKRPPVVGNPNHPVVREMQEQWYKLCAIVMHKQGLTQIEITDADIEAFMRSGRANITVHPSGNVITLRLVSDAEAEGLARQEGGLPA